MPPSDQRESPESWHSKDFEERSGEGWPSQVGYTRAEGSWKDAQASCMSCPGIPRRPDEPDCGCKVLRPGCRGRQGVIIYPHKVLRGGYFLINNFLWAQRCPRPRYHLIGCSHPLRGPAVASKAGPLFGCGGIRQLAPASSLLCSVSQRVAWSAAPFCWPGP